MGQFRTPHSELSRMLDRVRSLDGVTVRPFDDGPVSTPGAHWHRYAIYRIRHRALMWVSEHRELPGELVVTISPDLRRLPKLWLLRGDWRLVRDLNRSILQLGGTPID